MTTLETIEQQATRLLADVKRIRATADQGKAPDPDHLRQLRVRAAEIGSATLHLQPRK